MGRPITPPPAPPAPRTRNARLLDSAIGFGSILALLCVLRIVIPEIPTGLFVIASGALGAFFARDIFDIRQEEGARELRERDRGGQVAEIAREIAPEQIGINNLPANGIRRRGSSSSLTLTSNSSSDRSR